MGDRGNIVIRKRGQDALFMYTHWRGSDLPEIVALGLSRGETRWDDEQYLNRILFQTLVGKDFGTTGFGLSTEMGDGGTEVYIDPEAQIVEFEGTPYTYLGFIEQFAPNLRGGEDYDD